MAHFIVNCDFCFPSNFLLPNKENVHLNNAAINSDFKLATSTCFPPDFPYEFSSSSNSEDLISPFDSVGSSSTEAESDDEDLFNAMDREFARSSIQETKQVADEKTWAMFGSPQSTLIQASSWPSRSATASNVSSRGPPHVLSSLKTPFYTEKHCLDIFYAAAAQKLARSRMHNQGHPPIGASRKTLDVSSQPIKNHSTLFHSNESFFTHDLAQRQQLLQIKQSPMNEPMKMCTSREQLIFQRQRQILEQLQVQSREGSFGGLHSVRCGVQPLGMHEAAWRLLKTQNQNTNQQKYNCSGTRAAFLGRPFGGVKRECSGTGVFLPRQYNNHTQSHEKPGCSTALLPPRVVQALNLNVVDTTSKPQFHFHGGGFTSDYEALTAKTNPSGQDVSTQKWQLH